MKTVIRFGTSGWRAIVADEFTFSNVRLCAEAIGRYARERNASARILVGYDTRFLGERFGHEAARVLSAGGVKVLLCDRPVPTPGVSFTIRQQKLDGAVNITASHNPAEYNGLKFSTSDGAPALPEVTSRIEREIDSLSAAGWTFNEKSPSGPIEPIDIGPAYLADLATKVDLQAIKRANLKVAYDALHGSGAGYLDRILEENGIPVAALHTHRDVTFGGHHPEPSEDRLGDLRHMILERGLNIGMATDGDADRFGVLDADGTFIAPNDLIALLVDYLVESRGWKDAVARSVATSHLVDRVARLHGLELLETPVGFKYIGEYIKDGRIILGGEESAGLSIKGHLPEKDGILACLLAAEMVANRKKTLKNQLNELFSKVGAVYNRRLNVRLAPENAGSIREKISADVREFAGRPVARVNRTDGLKLIFDDDSWVLMRPSGTEPVVRFYAESGTIDELNRLLERGREWITGK
ncbi:MAG TPA: phosphoglucomutase/phosphomannomutase family protein [Terriglobia bacterium]|nr:phosphoglucomutase/phosphomannomutase family protein [Terriglobia bacterium]